MSTETGAPLKYYRSNQIRDEICALVGVDPGDRFGVAETRGLRKRHLQAVARELGIEWEDSITLRELYNLVCDEVGAEYNANAGNQWGMDRDCLKAIHQSLMEESEGRR